MRNHPFVNSDPVGFDSNCSICEGKWRDSIHRTEQENRDMLDGFIERMTAERVARQPTDHQTAKE